MRIASSPTVALLACCCVACSKDGTHNTPSKAETAKTTVGGVSPEDAQRIALREVANRGGDANECAKNYEISVDHDGDKYNVFFIGKSNNFGDHFSIFIDRQNGKVLEFLPGL